MTKFSTFIAAGLIALAPAAAFAQGAAVKGKMLYGAGGSRLGTVLRVTADGSAQIIIDGKLVTIPASTISADGDKVSTSLSKNEVISR
jgi:hypothetical protein